MCYRDAVSWRSRDTFVEMRCVCVCVFVRARVCGVVCVCMRCVCVRACVRAVYESMSAFARAMCVWAAGCLAHAHWPIWVTCATGLLYQLPLTMWPGCHDFILLYFPVYLLFMSNGLVQWSVCLFSLSKSPHVGTKGGPKSDYPCVNSIVFVYYTLITLTLSWSSTEHEFMTFPKPSAPKGKKPTP